MLDEIRDWSDKNYRGPYQRGLSVRLWPDLETDQRLYVRGRLTPFGKGVGLEPGLLQEVLFSQRLRPRLSRDLVAMLEKKLKRTAPGYAPRSAADLLDWIKERVLIPAPDWQELKESMDWDRGSSTDDRLDSLKEKIVSLRLPGASPNLIVAVEIWDGSAEPFKFQPEELAIRDVFSATPPTGRAALGSMPFSGNLLRKRPIRKKTRCRISFNSGYLFTDRSGNPP